MRFSWFFYWIPKVQRDVNLIDLVKSFQTNIFFAKIGVDTAENEPLKVHSIFKLWDLIFTEPPRPLPPAIRSPRVSESGTH